jgi:tetratricopeptide (TPR) repeat protein
LTLYTKALALVPERKEGAGAAVDEEAAAAAAALRITLLSNRAQAHLTLENNRAALEDAVTAGVADSANGKAHYRAARAAVRLGDWTAAAAAVERGLAAVPADPDFLKLRASVREQQATRDAADAAVAAAAASARAPARELAALVASRGVRVGLPQFSAAIGTRRPWVPPGSRLLHWPVLFAYPEAGPGASPDVVEAVPESEALGPHLDAVFAPDAPPLPWDGDSAYTRASVELYYLSHATKPLSLPDLAEALHGGWPDGVVATPPERYGPRAAHWVKVENVEGESLGALLSRPDMVVPGVPVFFVLAKGTAFRERWLEAAAE